MTYDMKPTIQVDFTRNKTEVQDALSALSYPGFNEANLFDAVVDTLEKLDRIKGKKAILLITTGIDTFSKARLDDTLDKLRKSNVTVFCVGVAESEYMMAETQDRQLFNRLFTVQEPIADICQPHRRNGMVSAL